MIHQLLPAPATAAFNAFFWVLMLVNSPASAAIIKPYPHNALLENALLAHECVDKVKLYNTICLPGDSNCNDNEVNVIMILKQDAALNSCIELLIAAFPDLHFVRKYPNFKWVIATYIITASD